MATQNPTFLITGAAFNSPAGTGTTGGNGGQGGPGHDAIAVPDSKNCRYDCQTEPTDGDQGQPGCTGGPGLKGSPGNQAPYGTFNFDTIQGTITISMGGGNGQIGGKGGTGGSGGPGGPPGICPDDCVPCISAVPGPVGLGGKGGQGGPGGNGGDGATVTIYYQTLNGAFSPPTYFVGNPAAGGAPGDPGPDQGSGTLGPGSQGTAGTKTGSTSNVITKKVPSS